MVEFLSLTDLLQLTEHLGAGPVRDVGLLEAAAARPRTTVFGEDAYPELATKAAALLHSVCRNHALVDGNKRLGWHAMTVFLALNGVAVELTYDEAFELTMRVAEGAVDVEDIAAALRLSE